MFFFHRFCSPHRAIRLRDASDTGRRVGEPVDLRRVGAWSRKAVSAGHPHTRYQGSFGNPLSFLLLLLLLFLLFLLRLFLFFINLSLFISYCVIAISLTNILLNFLFFLFLALTKGEVARLAVGDRTRLYGRRQPGRVGADQRLDRDLDGVRGRDQRRDNLQAGTAVRRSCSWS